MEGTPSQSSCSTGRLYWDEGTSTLVWKHWSTKYRSREPFQMGMFTFHFPREHADLLGQSVPCNCA